MYMYTTTRTCTCMYTCSGVYIYTYSTHLNCGDHFTHTVSAEAPDILYKSHYESPGNDDTSASGSRRKTRNSNGSRGVASRPGLRSQKILNKNDSEDDEGSVYDLLFNYWSRI